MVASHLTQTPAIVRPRPALAAQTFCELGSAGSCADRGVRPWCKPLRVRRTRAHRRCSNLDPGDRFLGQLPPAAASLSQAAVIKALRGLA
jgi:hypothetical protein